MKRSVLWLAVVVVLVVVALQYRKRGEPRAPASTAPAVRLEGISLGHWLAGEMQFGAAIYDCGRPTAFETLRERFGVEAADALLEAYRDHFITSSDLAALQRLGCKYVYLPVSAALLYDRPGETTRFERAAHRIDWLLREADLHGLGVVLNLRVRPGEWAPQPAFRGKRFPAVWSRRDVEAVGKLWSALAERYRDRPGLDAYDLTPGPCRAEAEWSDAFLAWSKAIVAADPHHTVYAPWRRAAVQQIAGDEQLAAVKLGFAADFTTAAMTGASPADEARLGMASDLPDMDAFWRSHKFELLASTFNPVASGVAERGALGAFQEALRSRGWKSALWTYKSVRSPEAATPAGYSVVLLDSSSAAPDLGSASQEAIQQFVASLKTAAVTEDVAMKDALAAVTTPASAGAPMAKSDASAEPNVVPDGWTLATLGFVEASARSGGDGATVIASTGLGPTREPAELTFVHREAEGAIDLSVALMEADLPTAEAGAGLLVRGGLGEGAPFLIMYRGADRAIRAIVDNRDGQPAMKRKLIETEGEAHLRILRDGQVLKATCSPDGRTWPVAENFAAPWLTNRIFAGFALFSGHEYRSAQAVFRDLRLEQPAAPD